MYNILLKKYRDLYSNKSITFYNDFREVGFIMGCGFGTLNNVETAFGSSFFYR